ncbi:MAG TPA: hypothetical protein VGI87_06345 [Solirubrobacteraceae bacterium]|jgi:hypothetical protein
MDPQEPEQGSGAEEALRRLEERLARASEAAERLMAEAAGTAARAADTGLRAVAGSGGPSEGTGHQGPPPAGWQQPGADRPAGGDVELLSQILSSLRELIPPELQRRLADALRELLMALRALIDWYLERTEQRRAKPSEVEDIPIS